MTALKSFPIAGRWKPSDDGKIQLYSFPTPNGVKISIALEELGLPYEAHLAHIGEGDQKTPEFLSLSPNGKIEAARRTGANRKQQARIVQAIKRARYLGLLPYSINDTR